MSTHAANQITLKELQKFYGIDFSVRAERLFAARYLQIERLLSIKIIALCHVTTDHKGEIVLLEPILDFCNRYACILDGILFLIGQVRHSTRWLCTRHHFDGLE